MPCYDPQHNEYVSKLSDSYQELKKENKVLIDRVTILTQVACEMYSVIYRNDLCHELSGRAFTWGTNHHKWDEEREKNENNI